MAIDRGFYIPNFDEREPVRKGNGTHCGMPDGFRWTKRYVWGTGNNERHIPFGIGCNQHDNCFTCPEHLKDKCPDAHIRAYTSATDREVLPYKLGICDEATY